MHQHVMFSNESSKTSVEYSRIQAVGMRELIGEHGFQQVSDFAWANGSNWKKSSPDVMLRIDLTHRIFQ